MKKVKPTKKFINTVIRPLIDSISDKIDSINCGGCGVFALLLYLGLRDKYSDIEIACYDDYEEIEEKRNNIQYIIKNGKPLNESMSFSCSHVVVRIGNWFVDGQLIMTPKRWKKEVRLDDGNEGRLTIDELVILLKKGVSRGHWNNEYNRKQNKKVKKIIEHHLKSSIKTPIPVSHL